MYEIAKKYFKNEADSKSFADEIESAVDIKFQKETGRLCEQEQNYNGPLYATLPFYAFLLFFRLLSSIKIIITVIKERMLFIDYKF